MSKYYNNVIPTEIHFVYGGRYSGKTYREFKKLEEELKRRRKMNSGITLEEIKRLFNYLEENKTNNDLQIIMTTESCHDLYKLFINFNKYQKILEDRINKAIEYINNFESIRAYFEYTDEDGYDEYDYDDTFRTELLKILKGEENEEN